MAETQTKVAEKEPIFGKVERKLLFDPINDNNPITVQILGVCSALAVTSQVMPALVMALSVTFVTAFSNMLTSAVRNIIPKSIRMIVQLVIIALLVTVVELALKASNYPIWKQLSVYIGLIITNCIVMGRLEAYAMANRPWRSFLDGIGNGLGYGVILVVIAVIREIFGKGSLFAGSPIAIKFIGPGADYLINTTAPGSWFSWYQPNGIMVLPAASMFILGLIIWWQRNKNPKLIDIS